MLTKAFVIGVYLVVIAGCTSEVSTRSAQPQTEALPENTQQKSESSAQRRIRLAEEERETRKQAAQSSIKQLEQQMSLLSQRMLARQQKLSNLELQANQLETDLRTYNGNVQSFIMAHKAPTACIGVVGASLDKSNQYSKDAKDIAGMGTVACGIAFLANDEFRKEVVFVVDQLTQADSHAKNLMGQLQAIQSQISTENESLGNEQSEASKLASDIQKYQSQLEI